MADFNLKFIKASFALVIIMFVLAMTSGMDILRGTKVVDWRKIGMEMDFFRYKRALAAEEAMNAIPSAEVSGNAQSVPILLYHGIISGKDWEEDGTNTSLEKFKEQIFSLKKAGYRTITMADFFDYMKNGKKLPEKSIMITFDDGRKDSYYEGDPVLRAAGFNAVMFLITGRSLADQSGGDSFYLGKSELQDMIKSKRWEIQSHGDFDHSWEKVDPVRGRGHFLSNLLWLSRENRLETADEAKKRILDDLANSKKKIENELDQRVVSFAYPFNDFGQESVNFPEAEKFLDSNIGRIYPLTFYQVETDDFIGNYPDPKNSFLKRVDIDSGMSANNLVEILDRSQDKKLPYSDTFWNNRGWRTSWGEKKVWGDLMLSETEPAGGSMVTLVGSSLWKNYFFGSQAQITGGNSIAQVVRYKDDDNYAECDFSGNGISILQKVGGSEHVIGDKSGDFSAALATEANLGTEVSGNDIKCHLNGNLELGAQLSPDLAAGGVGFSVWDGLSAKSSAAIKKIEVSRL